MKKIIALITVLLMTLSLAACGGKGLSDEEMANVEKLGLEAGQKSYESYEHINDIVVAYPMDGKDAVEVLADNAGELNYFTSDKEMKKIKGIVFEDNSSSSEGTDLFEEIYLCDYESSGDGEAESAVKCTYDSSGISVASSVPSATLNSGLVEYNGINYEFDQTKGIVSGIKWFIAEDSVKFEKWIEENKEAVDKALAAEKAAKENVEGEWILSTEYFALQNEDSVYAQYSLSSGLHAYLEKLVSKLEEAEEDKYDKIYNKMLKQNRYENAVGVILVDKAKYEKNSAVLKEAAAADFEKYAEKIEELKNTGGDYKDTDDYLRIKAASTAIAKYEDNLAAIELLDNSIAVLNELKEIKDDAEYTSREKLGEAENDFASKYYQARMDYINRVIDLENFEAENKGAIETYETGVEAIKAQYDGAKEYKEDVEYMKLEVEYGEMLEQYKTLKGYVKENKKICDELKAEIKQTRKSIKDNLAKTKDEQILVPYLNELNEKIAEINTEENGDKDTVIGEIDGFYIVKMSQIVVDTVDDNRDVIVRSTYNSNSGSSGFDDGKAKYDPDDPYYSAHDYDGDGYMSGDEFQDAFNDAVNDMLLGM